MFEARVREIAEAVGGEVVGDIDGDALVCGVSTDSRAVLAGQLFVALRGEKFDGHDYVEIARGMGAVAAIVEREVPSPIAQIKVADALVAYGNLARWWREKHTDVTLIAITGSAGKTTTKGMLASILERRGTTLVNPGTENNEVGVPRALLRLGDEQYAVIEMAMRGRGQIKYLAERALPQIGVITNIGEAHIGILGSREQIAEAKAELIAALPKKGTAVLNADDFFYRVFAEMAPCRVASYGIENGDFRAENVRQGGVGARFDFVVPGGARHKVELRLPGLHNVYNALAAATAAWATGARGPDILAGLGAYRGEKMRSQVVEQADGARIINDAYNASPTSVAAALKMLAGAEGRKVLVFGDMLELGDYAAEAHRQVGEAAAEAGVAVMVAVGELGRIAGEAAAEKGVEVVYAGDVDEAIEKAMGVAKAGDVVLVKASRAVGLERVAEALVEGAREHG